MYYSELYAAVEALEKPPVLFNFLWEHVRKHHTDITAVKLFAIKYEEPTGEAYYHLEDERTSAYDEEELVAKIVFCETLQDDEREYRLALTKELMHVFDTDDERTNTRAKFIRLLEDIQNTPLWKHASAMYKSEFDSHWKAILLLCPRKFRDPLVADHRAKIIGDFDVAQTFEIPEGMVNLVMSTYYDEAYDSLVLGNGNHAEAPADDELPDPNIP